MFGLSSALLGVPRRPQPGDPDYIVPAPDMGDLQSSYAPTLMDSLRAPAPKFAGLNDLLSPQAARGMVPPIETPPAAVVPARPALPPVSLPSVLQGTPKTIEPAPMGSLPATMTQPAMSPDPNFVRTFTGSQGTTSYDMTPDAGKYIGTGISARGTPFAADLGQGKDLFAQQLAQAAQAQAMGDPHTQSQLAVGKQHGEFLLKEALARHHEMEHGKLLDQAMFNATNLGPNASLAEKQQAYQDTLRVAAPTLSQSVRERLNVGGPATLVPASPISDEMTKAARTRLNKLFTEGKEGGSFTNTPETAKTMADIIRGAPEAERGDLLQKAVQLSAAKPGFADNIVRAAAADWSMTGLPVQYMDWLNFPGADPRAVNPNIPGMQLVKSNTGNSFTGIERGLNAILGKPESLYNKAMLKSGRAVDLGPGDLYGGRARSMASTQEKQDAEARQKHYSSLIEALLSAGALPR